MSIKNYDPHHIPWAWGPIEFGLVVSISIFIGIAIVFLILAFTSIIDGFKEKDRSTQDKIIQEDIFDA